MITWGVNLSVTQPYPMGILVGLRGITFEGFFCPQDLTFSFFKIIGKATWAFMHCVGSCGSSLLLLLLPAWGVSVAGQEVRHVDVDGTRREKRTTEVLQPL